MKKLQIIVLCLLTFTACKKDGPLDKIKKASEGIKNTTKVLDNLEKANDAMLELKDLEPVSNEVLKAWMPEKLKDLKRTEYKIGNAGFVNISTINLQFKSPDDIQKQFKIEIIDGAGTGSGVIYMYKMIENTNLETENERGYEKIYKRDGISLKESYSKDKYGNIRTKQEFLVNNRFAVNVKANKIKPDKLWEYMKALNFKTLKN